METVQRPSQVFGRADRWELIRLLSVLFVFALWGHRRFGWGADSLPAIQKSIAGMVGVFCFFALLSCTLARLYAALILFPFYATTVLNDRLYRGAYWIFRTILRLLYMRRVSAAVALAGELGLFVALWRLIEVLLKRYCF